MACDAQQALANHFHHLPLGGGGHSGESSQCSEGELAGGGADPMVVRSLWEAYVWRATETGDMLQKLLVQMDKAMQRCSTSSTMFTRCMFAIFGWFHSVHEQS